MEKRLFLIVGTGIMLSVGVLTAMNMTERKQPSDLTMLNIEAMAENKESYATSSSQCFEQSGWNCVVTTVSGDNHVFQDVHPGYIAKTN